MDIQDEANVRPHSEPSLVRTGTGAALLQETALPHRFLDQEITGRPALKTWIGHGCYLASAPTFRHSAPEVADVLTVRQPRHHLRPGRWRRAHVQRSSARNLDRVEVRPALFVSVKPCIAWALLIWIASGGCRHIRIIACWRERSTQPWISKCAGTGRACSA